MIERINAIFKFMEDKLIGLPLILARVTVGYVFAETGWGKLQDLESITGYFTSLGIPFASVQAPVVSFLEFSCGALILLGLFTRLASIPLIGTMVVAILTAKAQELTGFSALFGFIEYLYIVLLVLLLVKGAGPLSLDSLVRRFVIKTHEKENVI